LLPKKIISAAHFCCQKSNFAAQKNKNVAAQKNNFAAQTTNLLPILQIALIIIISGIFSFHYFRAKKKIYTMVES
jgi:hypothetical protein